MLKNPIVPAWLRGAFPALGLAGFVLGGTYEIQKISVTGDAVPTLGPPLDEEFRSYQSVHMFPDATVAFAGVTTRGLSPFRNGPRGIYYAFAPGLLTTLAEIDDADAFRSIGLPHTLMDSNSAKMLAFDYVSPQPLGLPVVIANKVFEGPLQPLTPMDGTNALVSNARFPENTFSEGRFEIPVSGLTLNEAGQTLFSTNFLFKDDPNTPVPGIFQTAEPGGVRNIVFAGDNVPDIDGATFQSFGPVHQAENGTALFSAAIIGVPSRTNQTLWMEKEGEFTMLLREGNPAPGFADAVITLIGRSLLFLDVEDGRTIITSGISRAQVYWTGTTMDATLTPFLRVESSPNLNDPAHFTATDQGNVAFSGVDSSTMQLDFFGDIYFAGGGELADGESVNGLWQRKVVDGSISLLVAADFTNGLTGFVLLDIADTGDVLFLASKFDFAENQNVRGIWVRDIGGELTNVINAGDRLDEAVVTGFASYGSNPAGSVLGLRESHDLFSSDGDFVFVALFGDENGDGKGDQGVFLAGQPIGSTKKFLWSGDAGDHQWHKALNWIDEGTDGVAAQAPGDALGVESVTVPGFDVALLDRDAHVKEIAANGSLTLERHLTIEDSSSIENVKIHSGLTSNGSLMLEREENEWIGGTVNGTGNVVIAEDGVLSLEAAVAPLFLESQVTVRGRVEQGDAVLNLVGAGSKVAIEEEAVYEIMAGSMIDDSDGVHIENSGLFFEWSASKGRIDAFFENKPSGTIQATGAGLEFTDPSNLAGMLEIGFASAVTFDKTVVTLGTSAGDGFLAAGLADDDAGILRFSGAEVIISDNDMAVFRLGGSFGSVEVLEATQIGGVGILKNTAKFHLVDGTIESKVLNEDSFTINGLTGKIKADVENTGVLMLEGAVVLSDDDKRWTIANEVGGKLIKAGPGDAEIHYHLDNRGELHVEEGTLALFANPVFGDRESRGMPARVFLKNAAKLVLTSKDVLSGGGEFVASETIIESDVSGAELVIDTPSGIFINRDSRVIVRADARWVRGNFFVNKGDSTRTKQGVFQVGDEMGVGSLVIEGPEPIRFGLSLEDLGSKLAVVRGSSIVQKSDVTLSIKETEIEVSGVYRLDGAKITFVGSEPEGPRLVVNPSGSLITSGASSLDSKGSELHLNIEEGGIVQVDAGGTLTIPKFEGGVYTRAGLKRGSWILEENAAIDFNVGLPESDRGINSIAPRVKIDLSSGSTFGKFPDVKGIFLIRAGGTLILREQTLTTTGLITNLGKIVLHDGTVTAPAGFDHAGIFEGTGIVNGRLRNFGNITSGFSPGTITINGDFIQETEGELVLELGGTTPGSDYDQLVVKGSAMLGGRLRVECLEDDLPEDGALFHPLVANSTNGAFDEIILDVPSSRLLLDLVVGDTGVTATATVLDVSTYAAWRSGVFTALEAGNDRISGPGADPDKDGITNIGEYAFDSNPMRPNEPDLISLALLRGDSGKVAFATAEFPWAKGTTDVGYEFQSSRDLETWERLESEVLESVEGAMTTLTSLKADLAGLDSTFVRLRIYELGQ